MTHMPLVVGLTGRTGAGKDSCAQALVSGGGWQSIAFADAVREEVAQAWAIDPRMLTDRQVKELPLPRLAIGMCTAPDFVRWALFQGHSLHAPRSARWLLQHWATEYRRRQDLNYWVRPVQRFINRRMGTGWQRFVISDVRFPNEAIFVRGLGGFVLRVHRNEPAEMAADTADHVSEGHAAELMVDGDIHNDGALEHLPAELARVLAGVLGVQRAERSAT